MSAIKPRGFTTTPDSISAEFSWEAQQRRDNEFHQKQRAEQQRREEQQHQAIREMEERQRAENQRWEEQRRQEQQRWEEQRKQDRQAEVERARNNAPEQYRPDTDNPIHMPRYVSPEGAYKDYPQSADIFDPNQTIIRYPVDWQNKRDKENFERDHPGKMHFPEHGDTVYGGMPRQDGVDGLGRAYNSKKPGTNKYLFDMREYNQHVSQELNECLSKDEAVAVRMLYAIPNEVDSATPASIRPWNLGTHSNADRVVKVSRTTGIGVQIIGDPKHFKFPGPKI